MSLIYREETHTDRFMDDVICNRCGESCSTASGFDSLKLHSTWGYGSGKDCQEWEMHLCEKCADELEKWLLPGKFDKWMCQVDGTRICPLEEYERGLKEEKW